MIELNESNFNESVNHEELTVVDFYAPWCGPCRMLTPVLEQLSSQVKIVKVNTDDNPSIATEHAITALPTIMFFKAGKVLGKMVGLTDKARLEKKIAEYK